MAVGMDTYHFQSLAFILLCSINLIEGAFQGPENVEVIPGSNVTLRCRANDEQEYLDRLDIKWSQINSKDVNKADVTIGIKKQNGMSYLETDNPRYSFVETNNRSVYDLQINFVELSDAGQYTCSLGIRYRMTATLDVKYVGSPNILKRPADKTVEGGSTVRFSCQAIGTEDVKWYFSNDTSEIVLAHRQLDKWGEILYNSDRISFPLGNGWKYHHDIQISNVTQSDSGVYTCLVEGKPMLENVRASAKAKLEVTVCDVMKFTVKPQNRAVDVGDRTTFHCKPRENLPEQFEVYWVKFSPRSASADLTSIRAKDGTWMTEISNINYDKFDIIINDIAKSDWGFYTCVLILEPVKCPYNDVPTTATAKLSVKTKSNVGIISSAKDMKTKQEDFAPKLSSEKVTEKYSLGDSVYLPCNINDGSYGSNVFWFDKNFNLLFDGARRITKDMRMSVSRNENKQWYLFIKKIVSTDIGNYYCLISSQLPVWQKVVLNADGCPNTEFGKWLQFETLGKCYSPPSFATSFGAAQLWCRKTAGGYLAMPKTQEEKNAVIELMQDSSNVWIGLDSWRRWKFIWNDESVILQDKSKWDSKGLILDRCVSMNSVSKKYKSERCNVSLPFVCEVVDDSWRISLRNQRKRCPDNWVYFQCGGFCYWAAADPMTRSSARLKCEELGGSLLGFSYDDKAFMRMIRPTDGIEYSEAWTSVRRQTNVAAGSPRLWFDDSWGIIGMYNQKVSQIITDARKPRHDQDCFVFAYSNPSSVVRSCNLKRMCVCKRYQYVSSTHSVCGKALPFNQKNVTRKKRDSRSQMMKSKLENDTEDEHHFNKAAPNWNEITKHKYRQRRQENPPPYLGKLSGSKAIGIESVPWFVQVFLSQGFNKYRPLCGGAIIGGKWILTAAHCLYHKDTSEDDTPAVREDTEDLRVVRGAENQHAWSGLMSSVRETFTYNYTYKDVRKYKCRKCLRGTNDIALLELGEYIQTDCPRIGQICIDQTGHINLQESECYYTGLGGAGGYDDYLAYCRVDNITQGPDEKVFRIDWKRCEPDGGDSGSPLMCRKKTAGAPWFLYGVLSQRNLRGMGSIEFTKVSAYYPYFKKIMDARSTSKRNSGNVNLRPPVTSVLLTSMLLVVLLESN